MKALHYAMMGVTLVALLAISVGAIQPWMSTAEAQHGVASDAQHGHAAEAQEHFDAFAAQLELTAEQQHALAAPFEKAATAMQEIHQLHEVIVAELDEAQKEKLAQMIHDMLGAAFAEQMHGPGTEHEASH